jgi:hypothetical protein
MDQQENKLWIGQLSLDLLFEGSKSEAFYPVLHCEDGIKYRVYLKGVESLHKGLLSHFMGQRVTLKGRVDNLRGHWRLVVDTSEPDFLSELTTSTEEVQPPANLTSESADE